MAKWKLPTTTLHSRERLVLTYLTDHAEECGIERTNIAIQKYCFGAQGSPSGHAFRTLRSLMLMGLIVKVRKFGVVYWDRVKVRGGSDVPSERSFSEKNVSRFDCLRSDVACAVFQALCFRHPDPLTVEQVDKDVLFGEGLRRTQSILEMLAENGMAESNELTKFDGAPLCWWPTARSLSMWERMRDPHFDEKIILQYLEDNFEMPKRCTTDNICAEALLKVIDGSGIPGMSVRVRKAIKRLRRLNIIYQSPGPERVYYWRIKGMYKKNNNKEK